MRYMVRRFYEHALQIRIYRSNYTTHPKCVKVRVFSRAFIGIFVYTNCFMETGNKLQELAQKISLLSQQPVLNQLEQDLLRSYLLQMYDALLHPSEATEQKHPPVEESQPEITEIIPVAEEAVPLINDIPAIQEERTEEVLITTKQETEVVSSEMPEAVDLFSLSGIEEPEPIVEPVINELMESREPVIVTAPEAEEKKAAIPKNVIQLISSEKVDEEKLKDRIAPDQKTLADKMLLTPIDNIKSQITLNKKVAYIIGLFNQESEDYNKALDQLNTADNLQDALNTFHMLRTRYNWKPELDLARELEQLVRRRYTTSA